MSNCFNFTGGVYDFWWWSGTLLMWLVITALIWKVDKLKARVDKLERGEK